MKRKWGLAPKPSPSLCNPLFDLPSPKCIQLSRRTRATVAMNHLPLKLDQSLGGPSKTFGKESDSSREWVCRIWRRAFVASSSTRDCFFSATSDDTREKLHFQCEFGIMAYWKENVGIPKLRDQILFFLGGCYPTKSNGDGRPTFKCRKGDFPAWYVDRAFRKGKREQGQQIEFLRTIPILLSRGWTLCRANLPPRKSHQLFASWPGDHVNWWITPR